MSEEKNKYKVVIADDEYVSRTLFEMLIKSSVTYELSASFSAAEQAVNYCRINQVDLVILDVMMKKGLDGLTCAETIKRNNPKIKVILATSTGEYKWIEEAKQENIDSFWFKEYHESSLLDIMDRTMNGESVYPSSEPDYEFGDTKKSELTERELEVLRELTTNRSNEEIAEKFNISLNTVKRHIQNMLNKTGYKNRLELAINAKALGLVVHDDDRKNPHY
ncbi:two-component system, NarL family, vancomycin resistance associated response regulator VraR [Lachnospiraceae bacterium NE2001]|nr:two-component system, NarL family, vancomycin resistance associated response regulator VraR [Lachnospiraceae bacterium NE2001]